MKSWRAVLSASGLGGLVACSPLQQAPLVYSSKVAVGVDIGATSTESPGFGFTVGYKQLDAAYVPVAVAKPCDASAQGDRCDGKNYVLVPLGGDSTTEGARSSGPTVERAKKALQEYNAANKAAFVAEATVNDLSKQIETAEKRVGELESIPKPATAAASAVELSPKDSAELSKMQQELPVLRSQKTAADEIKRKAEARAKELEPDAEVAEQFLDKLTRKDAHSVFGRFEGDISGSSSEGKVSLGKVFSTGVASQNLTAGLQKYYEGLSASTCIDAVAKLGLKDDAEKIKLLASCKSPAKP